MIRTFNIAPWHIETNQWDPENKRIQESITSLGNENLGMRGFYEEGYSGDTLEGIYLGGVWYPDKTRVGWWKNGYPKYFGKVINSVNFMKLLITVNGEQLDLNHQVPQDFSLDLDMQKAILTRSFRVEIGGVKLKFIFERFVSAALKELVGQRLTIKNLSDSKADIE
ncbi:MAG: glycoside hydrolase family 65 protein, partial [Pediococcus pentosaceus]|nr:glycoside hydrolase family 65 protein [Pediococcus pentosaceus]